jgi:hypothetical protein
MKKIISSLLALWLALALVNPALAINKQVVVTGTAATIFTPGPYVKVLVIQNPSTSTGAVSISIDGTNAPTATLGIILQPGQQMIVTFAGGQGSAKIVKAILVSGAATLQVSTDDTGSS